MTAMWLGSRSIAGDSGTSLGVDFLLRKSRKIGRGCTGAVRTKKPEVRKLRNDVARVGKNWAPARPRWRGRLRADVVGSVHAGRGSVIE